MTIPAGSGGAGTDPLLSREAAIPQRQFTDDEIVERTLYGLINEGARVLEEGFALRASDSDVIYVKRVRVSRMAGWSHLLRGFGWLKAHRRAHFELRAWKFGARWKVSPLLRQLAEAGKNFRNFDEERGA
jgi:3-hydroxyacyl-CoA dehydrogenase